MNTLKRVEIIANHSVEEDIVDALEDKSLATNFTKIPSVHGRGDSDPKKGNHIWPEENFILIIYCGEEEAQAIFDILAEIKDRFPNEGIRYFVTG